MKILLGAPAFFGSMIEIIVEGRGGQGAVTGAQIIAEAGYRSKNYKDVSSFPSFGAERRGAPVQAYTRVSQEKIWTRMAIVNPDILIVLDVTILTQNSIDRVKNHGIIILNTGYLPEEVETAFGVSLPKDKVLTVATVDVNKICMENELLVENNPIVNTPILGSLSKVFESISLDVMKAAIQSHLEGNKKADLNVMAADFAAAMTKVKTFGEEKV